MKYINVRGREMTKGEVKKGDIIKFCSGDYVALGDSQEFEDDFGTGLNVFVEHNGEIILFAIYHDEDNDPWFPCDGWEELGTIEGLADLAEKCNVELSKDEDGYLVATLK